MNSQWSPRKPVEPDAQQRSSPASKSKFDKQFSKVEDIKDLQTPVLPDVKKIIEDIQTTRQLQASRVNQGTPSANNSPEKANNSPEKANTANNANNAQPAPGQNLSPPPSGKGNNDAQKPQSPVPAVSGQDNQKVVIELSPQSQKASPDKNGAAGNNQKQATVPPAAPKVERTEQQKRKDSALDIIKFIFYIILLGNPIILFCAAIGFWVNEGTWMGKRPEYLDVSFAFQISASSIILIYSVYVVYTLSQFKNSDDFLKTQTGSKRSWTQFFWTMAIILVVCAAILLAGTIISGVKLLFMRNCEEISSTYCPAQVDQFFNTNFVSDFDSVDSTFCKTSCACYWKKGNVLNGITYAPDGKTVGTACTKSNSDNFKIMAYLENKYSCAGLCTAMPYYQFNEVNSGSPDGLPCFSRVCQLAERYYWCATVAPGWEAAIILFLLVPLLVCYCRLVTEDSASQNGAQTNAAPNNAPQNTDVKVVQNPTAKTPEQVTPRVDPNAAPNTVVAAPPGDSARKDAPSVNVQAPPPPENAPNSQQKQQDQKIQSPLPSPVPQTAPFNA